MSFPHTADVIQQLTAGGNAAITLLEQYRTLSAGLEAQAAAQRQRADAADAALAPLQARAEAAEEESRRQKDRADALEAMRPRPLPAPGPTASERLDALIAELRERGVLPKG